MESLIPLLAELFFYLALPLVVIYVLIFGYHWYNFGTKHSYATVALVVFLAGDLVLLSVMFVALQYVS